MFIHRDRREEKNSVLPLPYILHSVLFCPHLHPPRPQHTYTSRAHAHFTCVRPRRYENRSLSRFISRVDLPLNGPLDASLPTAAETKRVAAVLADFDAANLDNYWFHASGDANRASHYEKEHPGTTLVWPFSRKGSGSATQGTTSWGRVHGFFKDIEVRGAVRECVVATGAACEASLRFSPPPPLARVASLPQAALPGVYQWMPLDSLHITVRAIRS